MDVHTILNTLHKETQVRSEITLINESPNITSHTLHPPRPSPDPLEPSQWYIWAAVFVILVATAALLLILVYFCRRTRDHRPSLEAIITNIELQNEAAQRSSDTIPALGPRVVPTRVYQEQGNGENHTRITIIQKY